MRIENVCDNFSHLAPPPCCTDRESLAGRGSLTNRLIEADRWRQIIDRCDCTAIREPEEETIEVQTVCYKETAELHIDPQPKPSPTPDTQIIFEPIDIPLPVIGNLLDVYA